MKNNHQCRVAHSWQKALESSSFGWYNCKECHIPSLLYSRYHQLPALPDLEEAFGRSIYHGRCPFLISGAPERLMSPYVAIPTALELQEIPCLEYQLYKQMSLFQLFSLTWSNSNNKKYQSSNQAKKKPFPMSDTILDWRLRQKNSKKSTLHNQDNKKQWQSTWC